MKKKTPFYIKFLTIWLLCLTSCVSACTTIHLNHGKKQEILPREAFVQIQQSVELEACGLDPETKESKCQKAVMRYVSSGAYVFHSEVSEGTSYALTAGHSCEASIPKVQNIRGFKITNKGSTFTAVGLNGSHHQAEVVNINGRFDLCLLKVSDVLKTPPILKVAKEAPKRGEIVTNMAAPHGLFWPGTVLIFKGVFSGYHPKGYSVYSLPTKPGSSGSPIINSENKLVGVIFAGYSVIESVGLSSPLVAIRVFLKKSIAIGEMKLWESGHGSKTKTQIDRLWIEEMRTKLNKVFGK